MTNQEATTKENLVVQKCPNPFTRRKNFTINNQFFEEKHQMRVVLVEKYG